MLKTVDLMRLNSSFKGTTGILSLDQVPICFTLEEPWLNNERNISCIPTGAYDCTWIHRPKFLLSPIVSVQGVPGRSHIQIHPGNTLNDIEGCILPGRGFATSVPGGLFIENSSLSLQKLYSLLKGEKFILNVFWISEEPKL